jgi:hypothetical protein
MKRILLIATASICALIIALAPNQKAHSSGNGAATGYTGSPLEFSGRTCGSGGGCHGGGVTSETGWITSDIPACGYTPGETYNITVFVTSAGRTKFGFSCSPQFPNALTAGVLISDAGMQLNGGGRYITHTSSGTAQNGSNSRTWTFQWIAPIAGSGSLTFYAAMNATNSNNSSSGDEIHKSTLLVNENVPVLIQNSGNDNFCSANPVTLTSTISGNNEWTLNGNLIGIDDFATASESGTYILVNTNGECIKNASIILTADDEPEIPVVTNQSGDTILCPDESAELVATGTEITWQPGNVIGNTLLVTNAGSYTASATNSCGTVTSVPIVFTSLDIPISPEVTSGVNFRLCPNDSIELVAFSEDDILWSPGGETTSSIFVSSSDFYSAVAMNACGSSEPTGFNVIDMPLPATPIISTNGPTDFCEGDEVVLSVFNFTFEDIVFWQPNNTSAFNITVTETGTYSVYYSNMCGLSDVAEMDVYVESAPETPVITLTGEGLLEAGITANLFTWYRDGVQVLDEEDPTLVPVGAGIYTVQAFSDLNCPSALSLGFNYNPTAITKIKNPSIEVYPNPSNGLIYVNSSFEENQKIHMFDLSGKNVFEVMIPKEKNTPIELPLQAGMYILSSPSGRFPIIICH